MTERIRLWQSSIYRGVIARKGRHKLFTTSKIVALPTIREAMFLMAQEGNYRVIRQYQTHRDQWVTEYEVFENIY